MIQIEIPDDDLLYFGRVIGDHVDTERRRLAGLSPSQRLRRKQIQRGLEVLEPIADQLDAATMALADRWEAELDEESRIRRARSNY